MLFTEVKTKISCALWYVIHNFTVYNVKQTRLQASKQTVGTYAEYVFIQRTGSNWNTPITFCSFSCYFIVVDPLLMFFSLFLTVLSSFKRERYVNIRSMALLCLLIIYFSTACSLAGYCISVLVRILISLKIMISF